MMKNSNKLGESNRSIHLISQIRWLEKNQDVLIVIIKKSNFLKQNWLIVIIKHVEIFFKVQKNTENVV